jgi:hypothetical protein
MHTHTQISKRINYNVLPILFNQMLFQNCIFSRMKAEISLGKLLFLFLYAFEYYKHCNGLHIFIDEMIKIYFVTIIHNKQRSSIFKYFHFYRKNYFPIPK